MAMNIEKQAFKLGEMLIDNKQVFWKMQHCFSLIPIVQLLDGRKFIFSFRCSFDHKAKSIGIQSALTCINIRLELGNPIHIKVIGKLL
jgi:hypothetical protein